MCLKGWDVIRNNFPHKIQIHAEVIVDDQVPKAAHLLPGNFRRPRLRFCIDATSGFREYLKIPENCVLDKGLRQKYIPTVADVSLNSTDTFEYVLCIKAIPIQNGTASCNIASRNAG